MPIYHIACHTYKKKPTPQEFSQRAAMMQAAFGSAPYVEEGITGLFLGDAKDEFHDAACVKFKDIEAYREHMLAPHGPDEANYLRQHAARVRAFDIITPDEPADTSEKIIQLYKERWAKFPDVAKVLREEVDASMPYL